MNRDSRLEAHARIPSHAPVAFRHEERFMAIRERERHPSIPGRDYSRSVTS